MKIGTIYRYFAKDIGSYSYIAVYDYEVKPFQGKKTNHAIGVCIDDSTDIRIIPDVYWKYWDKVE
jgi:hypothetical protein